MRRKVKDGKATMLKDNLPLWGGYAALYQVDPAHTWKGCGSVKCKYLIAYSVAPECKIQETALFNSNEDAKVLNWQEIDGSFYQGLNHAQSLKQLGYSIVKGKNVIDMGRTLPPMYDN